MAAEILSINNEITLKYLLEEVVFTQQLIEEQIEIQVFQLQLKRQIEQASSDRSYSSIKSNQSVKSNKDLYQHKSYEESDKQNFITRKENDLPFNQIKFQDNSQNPTQSGTTQSYDIDQDDFPDVKKTKMVKVKEKKKKMIKRPYQPLIFHLLRYFYNEKTIYILDGYVCKVLQNVINNKLSSFLGIIKKYNRFNDIKRIVSHIQSSSVEEFLLNVVNRSLQKEQDRILIEQIALFQFIQRIAQISIDLWPLNESILLQKTHILSLYSSIIDKMTSKLTENAQKIREKQMTLGQFNLFNKIINKVHISKIIQTIKEITNYYQNHYLMPKILLQYAQILKSVLLAYCQIKNIIKKKVLAQKDFSFNVKELIQSNEDSFDKFINHSVGYIFENILLIEHQEVQSYRPKHSLASKISFLQILAILIKQNVYFSRKTLIDCYEFPRIFELFRVYKKSSILHNNLTKILLPYFKEDAQNEILDEIFTKKALFQFLYRSIKENYEIQFEKKDKNRMCYISQVISICRQIQKITRLQSQAFLAYKKSYEWEYISQWITQEDKSSKKQLLGGHQKPVNRKAAICFSKQQSLTLFRPFLQGLKYNMFDQFDNYEPENTDSQDEGQRKMSKKRSRHQQQQQNEQAQMLRGQLQKMDYSSGQYDPELKPKQINDNKYFNEDEAL